MNLFLFIQCDVKNNLQNFSKNNEIREIDSLINKAKLGYENVGDENIINTYKNIAEKAKKINYDHGLSKAYLEIAAAYYQSLIHNQGSEYLFLAEQYAHKDPELLSRINLIKGFILLKGNSFEEAKKKFNAVIKHANKIDDKRRAEMYIDRSYINIGNIYFNQEKYDFALNYYFKGYKSSDIANSIGSSVNIAETYLQMNKIDSANKYLKIADQRVKSIPEKNLFLHVNEGLIGVKGLYHIKKGNYEKAIEIIKDSSSLTTIYRSEELLGMAYAKLGNNDSATFYFQKYMDYKMNNKKNELNTYKALSIIQNDEKIVLENKQKQQRKTYLWYIVLSALSIITLIIMLYFRQKMNKERTRLLLLEKERLEVENELSELKQEHYQKQVLSTSIQLEQKNKFLEELKGNISKNNDFNLNSYLKNEQFVDKNLTNIHDIVKEVHPNFFNNLNNISNSKLTNLDIKYAAYIYMNMDNSQIAAVLNVDPRTVSVTKHRLKKKLDLSKDIDLETFIKNLK